MLRNVSATIEDEWPRRNVLMKRSSSGLVTGSLIEVDWILSYWDCSVGDSGQGKECTSPVLSGIITCRVSSSYAIPLALFNRKLDY